MTGAEKTLKWYKDFVEKNGHHPLISEVEAQLEMAVENEKSYEDPSKLTLAEGRQLVDYGFWYCEHSQHEGEVPLGNYLQKLVGIRRLIEAPPEWLPYMRENGYDR